MATEGSSGTFKSFVSEEQLEEQRKKRQEEWEKVRQPDQPLEAPEEEYDPRSLFDKLQEQKAAAQEKYEEQFALRNQVKGLEEDEVDFLDYVSDRQQQLQREREEEDSKLVAEVQMSASAAAPATEPKMVIRTEKKSVKQQLGAAKDRSQKALLSGMVKRKSSSESKEEPPAKKLPTNSENASKEMQKKSVPETSSKAARSTANPPSQSSHQVARPIGIMPGFLPGLGEYTESSESESSSDSEVEMPQKKCIHVHLKGHGHEACG